VTRDVSAVGRVGVLTAATRGDTGPGEVLIKIRGGSETYLAWSDEALPKGANVLVVESRGARAVDVTPWFDAPGLSTDVPE
jgi:membrane protein implicated in regulation of membrane protease activity